MKKRNRLLIVPYGIETFFSSLVTSSIISLLIVPYGIETIHFQLTNHIRVYLLLIVPYGIETVPAEKICRTDCFF